MAAQHATWTPAAADFADYLASEGCTPAGRGRCGACFAEDVERWNDPSGATDCKECWRSRHAAHLAEELASTALLAGALNTALTQGIPSALLRHICNTVLDEFDRAELESLEAWRARLDELVALNAHND